MSSFHLTSHLTLFADPVNPMHAATKQYVDAKVLNVDGSRFVSGVLAADKLPALSGDIETVAGSTVVTLKNNAVVAGTYNTVTVDSKGRAVSGTNYTPEYTNVSWNLVTGKPTTLAGYGITDVLSTVQGGTVASVTVNAAANTEATTLVTKAAADNAIGAINLLGVVTGDIIRDSDSVTPGGYLRANGGVLSKADYSALYAVVGDTYNVAGSPGYMGQPWRQQYAFNTSQSADITGWITGTSLPGTFTDSHAIVTSSRVYLLSGYVNGNRSSAVYTTPINSDGTLGTWTTGTSLPATVAYSHAIVTRNRVYLLGGYIINNYSSTVYTAPINSDGTLGAWTTGTSLPATVAMSQAIVTNSRVYLLGGTVNGSHSSTVYTAPINADGTLGTWTTGTSLPDTVANSQAIVTSSRVYLLGGFINGVRSSTVYTASINADGTLGTWTTGPSLPATVVNSHAIVTSNRVYLLSGYINNAYSSTVYTAPINSDGTLGAWTTGTSLPGTVGLSHVIVTRNRVYLLGGYVNGSDSSTVYTAPFTGGSNDYLTLIESNSATPSTHFKLPDYTSKETDNLYYYIKT